MLWFWCALFPMLGLIALVKFVRRRSKEHILRWLLVPTLAFSVLHWAAVGFQPVTGFLLLFIPSLAYAAWVADRISGHYAAWMTANPLLDLETRRVWANRWEEARFIPGALPGRLRCAGFRVPSGVDPEAAEPAQYALAFIGVFLAALVSFGVLLGCRASDGGRFVAGMAAILVFVAVLLASWFLWNNRLQPNRLRLLRVCGVAWAAILSWLSYNSHDTRAPGVFQSPSGCCARRRRLFGWATFLLSLSILPLSAYFPVVLIISGPLHWIEADLKGPAEEPAARVVESVGELDEGERLYYDQLSKDAERRAYLSKVSARHEEEASERAAEYRVKGAYAQLTAAPESWLWPALWRTLGMRWYFSLALFLSLALSLVAGPVLFFVILTFVAGRLLSLYHSALEGSLAYDRLPGGSVWDARVARLRTSSARGTWDETTVREKDHLWLGTSVLNDYPVLLSRKVLTEHAHIMGSTGSGKTALGLAPLITQLIRHADSSVVIIDLKGDKALFTGARDEALGTGLPFQWFTDKFRTPTFVFNPLHQAHRARLSTYQRTDMLIGAFGLHYSRAYGEAYFSDVQNHLLFRALQHEPDCSSFVRLHELLRNRALYRDMDKKELRDASHIWKIVHRLASFPALNATDGDGTSKEALDHAIDLGDVFCSPRVVYFYLPAALESVAVAEIARLALYNLLTAAVGAEGKRPQVFLFIDEFQQIVSNNLEIVLRQARKFGIGMILANQALADLKTKEVDLTPIVSANTNFRQIFSANDVPHQDLIIKSSGEALYELVSVTENSLRSDAVRTQEVVGPRLWRNDIIDFSNHPQRSLVQIDRGHGFTQFGGYPFVITSKFHISEEEYKRREDAPWPECRPHTVIPQVDGPQAGQAVRPHSDPRKPAKEDYSTERAILEEFLKEVMENEGGDEGGDEE